MSRPFHLLIRTTSALVLLGLFLFPLTVFAHQSVPVGNYDVEYGWVNEPVILNQPNAVVVNITPHQAMAGSLQLVAPANHTAVQGTQIDVTVQLDGLSADAADSGVHWHLYWDNQELAMISLDQTTVTLSGLINGDHTLKASLAGANHGLIGNPVTAMVMVSGAADSGTPMVKDVMFMPMGNSSATTASEAAADIDVSALKVEAVYGGETKTLTLQPLGEDTPGQFVAPLLPTRAGQYTIRFSGKIDGMDIQTVEVQPEEVQTPDIVQFPRAAAEGAAPLAAAQAQTNTALVIGVIGAVLGAVGAGLGVYSLARKK